MNSPSQRDFIRSFEPESYEWVDPDGPEPEEGEVPDLSDEWYLDDSPLVADFDPDALVSSTAPATLDADYVLGLGASLAQAQSLLTAAADAQAELLQRLSELQSQSPALDQNMSDSSAPVTYDVTDDAEALEPLAPLEPGDAWRRGRLAGPIAAFGDVVGSPQTAPAVRELVARIGIRPRATEYPDGFYFSFPAAGVQLYFERGICHTCFLYTQSAPGSEDPADALAPVASPPIDGLPSLATDQEIRAVFGEPTDTGSTLGDAWMRYQMDDRSLAFTLDGAGRTSVVAVSYRPS